MTNKQVRQRLRTNPTRKGGVAGGGEREKENSRERKKESRFNNRVIALFRITICQHFTKLYDT